MEEQQIVASLTAVEKVRRLHILDYGIIYVC